MTIPSLLDRHRLVYCGITIAAWAERRPLLHFRALKLDSFGLSVVSWERINNLSRVVVTHGSRVAQSVQCMATAWATGRSGFYPRQGQRIFPLSSVSRPALRPTQPPVRWVPGILSPGRSAAGAWRWPLTPISCRCQEWVGAVLPLPPGAIMACSGTALLVVVTQPVSYVCCQSVDVTETVMTVSRLATAAAQTQTATKIVHSRWIQGLSWYRNARSAQMLVTVKSVRREPFFLICDEAFSETIWDSTISNIRTKSVIHMPRKISCCRL
jgi:hypothetical protein